MRPRWWKVLRDIWLHKARALLVVLAIVVGLVGAGTVLNTWGLLRVATRDEYRDSNPPSAVLRLDRVDDALLQRVRPRPEIAAADARRTIAASVEYGGSSHSAVLYAIDYAIDARTQSTAGATGLAPVIGRLEPEQGTWPPADGAVALERSSYELPSGLTGGAVGIRVGESPAVSLRVGGIVRDVGLAPGWMEHVVYGFITRRTLSALGLSDELTELRVVVRDRTLSRDAVRRLAYVLKADIEREGHLVRSIDVPEPGRHIHAGQIESLLFTQGAFGVLSLLLSAFLVVNLMTAMLTGQLREIGVMKAMGASSEQLSAMYLVMAGVLGLMASMIALPVAAVFGRAYAGFTADLLNFNVDALSLPRRLLFVQLAVGILLPVIAAWVPVRRGCRISVSAAMNDVGITARGDDRAGRLFATLNGVSRPVLLSLRNAFRRRQRMAFTLLTLATGGAVFLAARNLREAIAASVDLLFSSQRYDASIRLSQPALPALPDSLERLLRSVDGVRSAEAWSGARANVQHTDSTLSDGFALVGTPDRSALFAPRLIAGRLAGRLAMSDRAITGGAISDHAIIDHALLVNTHLLQEEPSLQVGARVVLRIGGQPSTWTVIGVVETGPTAAGYVARDALAALVSNGRVDQAVISSSATSPGAQRDLLQRARLRLDEAGMPVQSTQLLQANRVVMEDHLQLVAEFLCDMAQLMLIVGGLGLAATISLSVLERTREIGVLRAIGATHGAILSMVYVEGLVLALASWLLAVPLSVPVSVALGWAFGRIMIPVPTVWWPAVPSVGVWLAVVLTVTVLSCAWPALRALRVPTKVALAYE